MSNIRNEHPGYYGVCMAAALPWYCGLGTTFLVDPSVLNVSHAYHVVLHYIPPVAWGIWYVLLGLTLAVCVTVPKIPHKYARVCLICGWLCTLFFLLTFILSDIFGAPPTLTLIPAFTMILLVEYRAILESEKNPSMFNADLRSQPMKGGRRARDK
jgi:hypothetical protein